MKPLVVKLEAYVHPDPELLGSKGAGLVTMLKLGMSVPAGFIITTHAGLQARTVDGQPGQGLSDAIEEAIAWLEQTTGTTLGSVEHPLVFSVRSGAPVSMPGQMPTILNVGLNKQIAGAPHAQPWQGQCYRDFLRSYARAHNHNDTPGLCAPPDDPHEQLWASVRAIWGSWDSEWTRAYADQIGLQSRTYTAVIVQQMVFGNATPHSASGVIFSRNPNSGAPWAGTYVVATQGDAVVSGDTQGRPITELEQVNPGLWQNLTNKVAHLERYYQHPVEVEWTLEGDALWLLQVRRAPLSDRALIEYSVEAWAAGHVNEEDVVNRVWPGLVERLRRPSFSSATLAMARSSERRITTGVTAVAGAGSGSLALCRATAMTYIRAGEPFVLLRPILDPREHDLFGHARAIVSQRSSIGSHGAVIAQSHGTPCVVGCEHIEIIDEEAGHCVIQGARYDEGVLVSVSAATGEVFLGALELTPSEEFPALRQFLRWWDHYDGTAGNLSPHDGRPHSPWGNATGAEESGLVTSLRAQARTLLSAHPWVSEKARVAEVMRLFPHNLLIRQAVIPASDIGALAQHMHMAIAEGFWCGLRTGLGPGSEGKAPILLGLRSHEEVEGFLHDSDFDGGAGSTTGGYPGWLDAARATGIELQELIVVFDPPEKGLPAFEHLHFVATVSCTSNPDEIVVEINPGASLLRSLEVVESAHLIRLQMNLNRDRPGLQGRRSRTFGKYLLRNNVPARLQRLAQLIEQRILDEWWREPIRLPCVMRALDEVYSLQVLELQGRYTPEGDIAWLQIFDAKGREEQRTARSSSSAPLQ